MLKVNKKHQNDFIGIVLVFCLLTLNIFHTFSYGVSIVDFEQVNINWLVKYYIQFLLEN